MNQERQNDNENHTIRIICRMSDDSRGNNELLAISATQKRNGIIRLCEEFNNDCVLLWCGCSCELRKLKKLLAGWAVHIMRIRWVS